MHILNTISEKVPVRFSGEDQWDGGGGKGGDVKPSHVPVPVSKLNTKQNLVGSLVAFLARQGRQLLLLEMRQWHLTLLWEKNKPLRKAKTQAAEALLSYRRKEMTSDRHWVFGGETLQRLGKH